MRAKNKKTYYFPIVMEMKPMQDLRVAALYENALQCMLQDDKVVGTQFCEERVLVINTFVK
jgi:imidazoleglycerol phosphate synthase glutamine amidotransferase subunit HisH